MFSRKKRLAPETGFDFAHAPSRLTVTERSRSPEKNLPSPSKPSKF
ncbi:MAG: hypothetical protein P4L28_07145 [Paludibacteraceae bacterium]|nr:hypothetical protein [Paludibacteraceae bacterium]